MGEEVFVQKEESLDVAHCMEGETALRVNECRGADGKIGNARSSPLIAYQRTDSIIYQLQMVVTNLQVLRGGMPSELCAVATLAVARRAMAKMQRKVERCMFDWKFVCIDNFCGELLTRFSGFIAVEPGASIEATRSTAR